MHLHFNYCTTFISSNKVIEHSAKHNLAKHKRTHTGEKPYELTHVLLTHVLTLHFMKDNELLFLFVFQKRLLPFIYILIFERNKNKVHYYPGFHFCI